MGADLQLSLSILDAISFLLWTWIGNVGEDFCERDFSHLGDVEFRDGEQFCMSRDWGENDGDDDEGEPTIKVAFRCGDPAVNGEGERWNLTCFGDELKYENQY